MSVITIQLDPCSKFSHVSSDDLQAACGMLTAWITNSKPAQTMKEALLDNYPYYMGEMTGGTLLPDGRYDYQGDSSLFPLVSFTKDTEVCFIYQYSIVGISTSDGETWVTRMD